MDTTKITITPQIPKLADLVTESETDFKENALMVLLNQSPPKQWLKSHPMAKIKDANGFDVALPYLPVSRVEYLLSRIFGKWWVEVRSVQCIANSTVVVVRVYVVNPVTKETEWNEGVGACPIQTDKGKGAMDWNFAKSSGVQISVPAAESYAFKDACEKFGKLFGKDLGRADDISYNELLKDSDKISLPDLVELYQMKVDAMTKDEIKNADRIIKGKETLSYKKLHELLKSK